MRRQSSTAFAACRAALLAPLLALAFGLCLTAAAPAQQASAPAPAAPVAADARTQGALSATQLEELSRTLRDDAQRQQFLGNLDALIAAKRAEEAPAARPDGPATFDRLAVRVTENVRLFAERITRVLSVVRRAPHALTWFEEQVTAEAKRERAIGLLWRVVAIVGIGMLAQFVFRRLTDGTRRRLEAVPAEESAAARVMRFIGRTLMLYLNALAYGAGAYAAYVLLPMPPPADAVLLVVASSFFVAKLILATARVALSPGVPGLRLGGMTEETAHYLYIWVRRLVRVFVYAFFLLEAMRLVGLPRPAYESLLYLTGLALVGFLVVFILQNRRAAADAIRGTGAPGFGGGIRAKIAGIWHLAAFAYIAAVYLVWLFKVTGGFEFLMIATAWSLLALVAAKVLIVGADRGLARVLRIGSGMADHFPGLEARANRYMPMLRTGAHWVIYAAALLLILDVWGLDTLGWLASPAGTDLILKSITIFVILFAALIIWEIVNVSITRYVHRLDGEGKNSARVRTLLPLARTSILMLLVLLTGLIVLSEIGVNIAPLLAGAGVLGLAIGFGSQKLVQDVITGLFILVEDTLAVGDVVRFGPDHSGIVDSITIRTVKLRDLSGSMHTLPFSEVRTIVNMTKDFAYYLMDVGVAYRENVDRVIVVLRELGDEMRKDETLGQFVTEPLEILGLDRFDDSAVIVRARLRIQPPIKQWQVGREFNRRMKARFDAEGIEIPFPHRTLYFGEDQKGRAPAAHVVVAPAPDAPAHGSPSTDAAPAPAMSGNNVAGDNVEGRDQAEAEANLRDPGGKPRDQG